MRPLIFTDLDDTIFASLRKQPESDRLTQGTTATNGHHSWLSPRQMAVYRWLRAGAELVPVTARSTDAFERVHLAFDPPAVLAMGAVIREADGVPNAEWQARMAGIAAEAGPALAAMRAAIPGGEAVRHWIVEEAGLPIYLCAKSNAETPADQSAMLAEVADTLRPLAADAGARLAVNGNNLSVVPGPVSKEAAVHWLLETRFTDPDRPVIGFGDSLSDLGFMGLADLALAPVGSQVWRAWEGAA